ncbi:glycosyltransferase family 2 protein [Gabonia massiliensis]|uniref:glycosyltransferase family 2 protein n=1 Tax=Gabonia massiliensis TaxID=1686296 RepID=UPI0006D82212|nr:glycosyltransferase family 2 protein [Gabonia massiliensis]
MQESEYPLVSICMPVYNGARFLSYTIDNILAQSYRNIELIIVDDGSIDGSYNIARQYINKSKRRGGIKVFSQSNEGAFSARNRALKESIGEYIMFMDCDDLISHHKIQRQIEILQENDPYTIVSCEWDTFYSNIQEATFPNRCIYKNYHNPIDMLIEMLNKGEMMQTSCWMIPRELIKSAGYWDRRFTINDDGVYFSKVLASASKVIFCSDARVYYRRGHASLSTYDIYSDKKLEALLDSYKEQAKILLAKTNLIEAYKGISRNFALVMCKARYNSPVYREAKDEILKLDLKPTHPHKGSKADKICNIIGFENFLMLRSLCMKKK